MRFSAFAARWIVTGVLFLPCSSARSDDQGALQKAAAFVMSGGREDFSKGPVPGTLVTADHYNLVFQVKGEKCIFQYRYNDFNRAKPRKVIIQADFRKMRKWWIGIPYMGRMPRIQLRGDQLGWCKVEDVSDEAFDDPTWAFSSENSRGCTGFAEMIINRDYLERVKDAFVYINENFCPYGGRPY